MKFTFRPPQPSDAEELARLFFYVWNDFYKSFVPAAYREKECSLAQFSAQAKETIEQCLQDPHTHYALIALDDQSRLAGFCCMSQARSTYTVLQNFDVELDQLYIWPDYQNQGLGTALLQRMIPWLEAQQFRSVYSWVFEQNPFCRFYLRHQADILMTAYNDYEGTRLPLTIFGWQDFSERFQ